MAEYKREGRGLTETRPIEAKTGVIPNATGSAYFKIGKTAAYAAVYGPRSLYPKFLQNPAAGKLRCHYNMMPFSGTGNRVRPGQNRRAKEISMVTEKSLNAVLDLSAFPNSVIDVFIEISEADAGTRCAGICAASMALADAGFTMIDMVAAISVGKVGDTVLVDLDYNEEAYDDEVSDIPVGMIPSTGEITLLQMDGAIDADKLTEALVMAKDACVIIADIQKAALREKYQKVTDRIAKEFPESLNAKEEDIEEDVAPETQEVIEEVAANTEDAEAPAEAPEEKAAPAKKAPAKKAKAPKEEAAPEVVEESSEAPAEEKPADKKKGGKK